MTEVVVALKDAEMIDYPYEKIIADPDKDYAKTASSCIKHLNVKGKFFKLLEENTE